jgi:hypothetical protein
MKNDTPLQPAFRGCTDVSPKSPTFVPKSGDFGLLVYDLLGVLLPPGVDERVVGALGEAVDALERLCGIPPRHRSGRAVNFVRANIIPSFSCFPTAVI